MTDFDPHRLNPDVHYRLYLGRDGMPTVVCVQDFDYPDYDESRFLSPLAWDNEITPTLYLSSLLFLAGPMPWRFRWQMERIRTAAGHTQADVDALRLAILDLARREDR